MKKLKLLIKSLIEQYEASLLVRNLSLLSTNKAAKYKVGRSRIIKAMIFPTAVLILSTIIFCIEIVFIFPALFEKYGNL